MAQACGGGGGGDSLRITLATTSLSWSYFPNVPPAARMVIANATGTYDGTLYVGAVVENSGASNAIQPDIPITVNGNQASASVTPAANLAPGTYSGRILFLGLRGSGLRQTRWRNSTARAVHRHGAATRAGHPECSQRDGDQRHAVLAGHLDSARSR